MAAPPATQHRARAHASVAERRRAGKAARARAPRSAHAGFERPPGPRDPIALLEAEAATRVPELVPIRHGRMLASPFAFLRGAASLMAADLAGGPRSGLDVQLCGDAHLANFGLFAAPDRRIVFDLNDFDETLAGPWEWDVKRLAASIEVAGRDRGFKRSLRRDAVLAAARSYREVMRVSAAMGNLDVWYARIEAEALLQGRAGELDARNLRAARDAVARAQRKDSLRAVTKLTRRVDGRLRVVSDPPLVVPVAELVGEDDAAAREAQVRSLLGAYAATLPPDRAQLLATFRFADMARKVVGVGSVGTRAWIVVLEGRDSQDALVLQAKEAGASVLEPHLGAGPYANHGERVVQGQRLMQAAGDIFLGWERATGLDGQPRDFYVRQLWDGKGSADLDVIRAAALAPYARLCGAALARAHARSGDRVAIASYLGGADGFDRAVARFAEAYADQNAADHRALQDAVASGRLVAQPGV